MNRGRAPDNLPEKANRILNGILVVLLLILFRVWHVAVVQHDDKVEEARKPQVRNVVERSERATICDRFGVPLATNKVQYNAAVSYGGIRALPRWVWREDEEGKRVKFYYRKHYITELASKLAEELHLDGERVEDLIHAKAAILGNVPYILKEDIDEKTYFKLKMLEKDWPGIYAEIAAKRCYPRGAVGGEVIGYIGPISRGQYEKITSELQELRERLARWEAGERVEDIEQVQARLVLLERQAYSINDFVGKAGVEAAFDESLRGLRGKRVYLADRRGKLLQQLPGSEEPVAGERLQLSISAELQEYAETLLACYAQQEGMRDPPEWMPENKPWIKEGAIVALDPKSGEVYALASFPRFDPNDFVRAGDVATRAEKNARVNQWLESEEYLAAVWDLKQPLVRERFDERNSAFYEEEVELSWETYLQSVLPTTSPVRRVLESKGTVDHAVWIQRKAQQLVDLFVHDEHQLSPAKVFDLVYSDEGHKPIGVTITLQERAFFDERLTYVEEQVEAIQKQLHPYFRSVSLNYDKLLLVDLYRVALDASRFTPLFTEMIGGLSLAEYREACGRMVSVDQTVRQLVKELYKEHHFQQWREEHFKEYLVEKREAEKEAGRKYARPYIEYLDGAEKALFSEFWLAHRWAFVRLFLTGECVIGGDELDPYVLLLKTWYEELRSGAHSALLWTGHYHALSALVENFDAERILIPFLQSLRAFGELDRPLMGAYSGLRGGLEKDLATAFYPRYGYGFSRSHAFRQAAQIGSIFKLIPAYEALRQRYIGDHHDLNPLSIIDDKHRDHAGFTTEGKAIPLYYGGGRVPRSDHSGIGKVDLVRALEASSNPYFALIAGDVLDDPEDLCKASALFGFGGRTGIELPGEYAGNIPSDVAYNRSGLYAMAIGQHTMIGTPLQTAVMLAAVANGGEVLKPHISHKEKQTRWRLFMPPEVQAPLLQGLKQVVRGDKGTARSLKHQFPGELVNRLVGKTSTAEVIERYSLDGTYGKVKAKAIWFGAIAYADEAQQEPDLVVVAYLKHGEWGKDAAPLVAKMVQKWEQVKSWH